MKPTLRYLFLSLLIAVSLIDDVYAQSDSDTATAQHKVVSHEAPITDKNMLEKIKQAMDNAQFLEGRFYADDNLNKFFGEPYVFQPLLVPKELNISVISFDSIVPEDQNKRDGSVGLSNVVPIFKNGKIYLSELENNQVLAHFVIAINTGSSPPDLLDVAMIKSVFGEPTSITAEPNADGEKKIRPLGNSWINYQVESGDIFKNILFRTDEDGKIVEIQLYIGKKQ